MPLSVWQRGKKPLKRRQTALKVGQARIEHFLEAALVCSVIKKTNLAPDSLHSLLPTSFLPSPIPGDVITSTTRHANAKNKQYRCIGQGGPEGIFLKLKGEREGSLTSRFCLRRPELWRQCKAKLDGGWSSCKVCPRELPKTAVSFREVDPFCHSICCS